MLSVVIYLCFCIFCFFQKLSNLYQIILITFLFIWWWHWTCAFGVCFVVPTLHAFVVSFITNYSYGRICVLLSPLLYYFSMIHLILFNKITRKTLINKCKCGELYLKKIFRVKLRSLEGSVLQVAEWRLFYVIHHTWKITTKILNNFLVFMSNF